MTQHQNHLDTLQQIRSLMEKSSRFISLSGLSGISAGIFALLGAGAIYVYLEIIPFSTKHTSYIRDATYEKWGIGYLEFFFATGISVLILAILSGIYFTTKKAKRLGQPVWDRLTQRLLISLFIPLITGGVFALGLLYHGGFGLIAPSTLIFYGLALLNASKYTLPDIQYLGISEIILGLIATFFLGYGLEFWAIGFGVLHIIYGTVMYFKYERNHNRA